MVKHVNLLIPELLPKFDPFALKHVLLASLALFILLTGLSANAIWQKNHEMQQQAIAEATLTELQTRISESGRTLAERRPSPALENEIAQFRHNLHARAAALRTLAQNTALTENTGHPYSEILNALGRQTMEGVWLTGIDAQGEDIEIQGRMRDHALLPIYLQKLNTEPAFQRFRFSALAMKGVKPSEPAPTGTPAAATVDAPFVEFSLRTMVHAMRPEGGKDGKELPPIASTMPLRQLPASLQGLLSEIEQLPAIQSKMAP